LSSLLRRGIETMKKRRGNSTDPLEIKELSSTLDAPVKANIEIRG